MIVVALAILVIAAVPLLGTARAYNPLPTGVGTVSIEPNPWLEGNVTISTHASTYSALQYAASSGTGNLSARIDPRVVNPLSVNPSDIVATGTIQQEKAPTATASAYWNSSTYWGHPAAQCANTITAAAVATVNGISVVQASENATHCAPGVNNQLISSPAIPISLYPSVSPAFDYVTMIYGLAGPACPGGAGTCYAVAGINNASNGGTTNAQQYTGYAAKTGTATEGAAAAQDEVAPGGIGYYSMSLAQLSNSHCGFNTTAGGSYSASIQAMVQLVVPSTASTTDTYTVTIYGWEFSTSPFTFGTTVWAGASVTRNVAFGNLNLTTLAPSQSWQSVSGGGYTEAIVQRASDLPSANVTITTTPINVANATAGGPSYVQQATYQFTFGLPVAASLSYGTFKLNDQVNVSGVQYLSVSFGGTSYTTTYQAYATCTSSTCTGFQKIQVVQASVAPTTAQAWQATIYYTGPQWDSISVAPGLFSPQYFSYIWFVFLGVIVTALGLSSAWVVQNRRAQQIRSPRGVARVLWFIPRRRGRTIRDRQAKLRMEGHHHAMVWIGILITVAGVGAIWAIYSGADPAGAAAAFIGTLLLAVIAFAVGYIVFVVSRRARRRGSRSG